MYVVLVKLGRQSDSLTKIIRDALACGRSHQAAPSTLRKVEVCRFLSKILSIHTDLEGGAKHYIVSNVFISAIFLWELKEEWLVHGIVGIVGVADL